MPTLSLENLPSQFDRLLSFVNRFIWPSDQNIDVSSSAFYVFKAFPNNLKKSEIKQWAELQAKTLSPFVNGDSYQYISRVGLHLWVSKDALSGIPESAAQSKFDDGEHQVQGKYQQYQQRWKNGYMMSCVLAKASDQTAETLNQLTLDATKPWAIERKIDAQLKKPSVWLAIWMFVGLCSLSWGISGYASVTMQSAWAEQKSSALSDSLGDKLAKQINLRNNQQILSNLQLWHQQQGFFPETFAAIAEKLSSQGIWRVSTVTWQNKIVEIEFVFKNVDITSLIGDLEKVSLLQKVNIRPHNAENTWILEAQLK